MVHNAIGYHVNNYCYIPVVASRVHDNHECLPNPNLLSDRNEDEDLSLETSDLVSVLKS